MSPFAIALFAVLAQSPEAAAPADAPPAAESTEATPEAAPAPEATPAPEAAPAMETPAPEAAPAPAAKKAWYEYTDVTGFARIGAFYTFPFQNEQLVGGNGGFRMAEFRLGFAFHPVEKFDVVTSVEFSAPLADPLDPLTGRRIADLRDAYAQYEICEGAVVKVGQFRPPYYEEMLISDSLVPFVNRSILASGVHPPEGYGPRTGLAPDRQLGVQLGSKRLGGKLGYSYAVGVFNGNGQNQLFNDNNAVEPAARVTVDYDQRFTLGLNASYNPTAQGTRPNRLYADQLSYGADVEAKFARLHVLLGFLGRNTSFSYGGLNPESALGAMGQVRYLSEKTGLEAAVRGAWLEPSSAQPDDQVIELAAMVGWRPFKLPFRVLLQFTHREEETNVAYPNDSVDAMFHATW